MAQLHRQFVFVAIFALLLSDLVFAADDNHAELQQKLGQLKVLLDAKGGDLNGEQKELLSQLGDLDQYADSSSGTEQGEAKQREGEDVAEMGASRELNETLSTCVTLSMSHFGSRWWYDLCTRPDILTAVEDLLGPDVLIWKSQLCMKEPGSAYVGWHQDATYWVLEPPECVNVWIALTDMTADHGPLEFLAKSQGTPLPTLDAYTVDKFLTRGQDIDWQAAGGLDEGRVHKAILKPGEFSIHHLCTAHGSKPNGGPGRRIGFNVTYVDPHVASIRPDGAPAMLVKGVDPPGTSSRTTCLAFRKFCIRSAFRRGG